MIKYTALEEQTLKPHQYLVVIKYDSPVGKIFYTDDGSEISKNTLGNATHGIGRCVHVPTVDALAQVIREVSECHNSVLVNGYYPSLIDGQEFDVVTAKEFKAHFNKKIRKHNKPKKINGSDRYTVTRTAEMLEDSAWICFDLDMSEHMPSALTERLNTTPYQDLITELNPALKGVDFLSVASSSSRVTLNGESYSKQNRHIYMQMSNNIDGKRLASSLLLCSVSKDLHFITPIVNALTGEVDHTKKGTLNTIFDRSVFSKARVMFEGKPSIYPHPSLFVKPQAINPTTLEARTINTLEIKEPTFKEQEKYNHIISRTNNGVCEVVNTTDLTLDTMIQVKHVDSGYEPEWITMGDFIAGDVVRYRAQNPFKPSSTSWSALLNKVNEEGEPCTPFLFSSEYGKYIVNNQSVALRLLGGAYQEGNVTTPPAAPTTPPAKVPPSPPSKDLVITEPDESKHGWMLRVPLNNKISFVSYDGIEVERCTAPFNDIIEPVTLEHVPFDTTKKEPRSGVFKAIRNSYENSVLPESDQLSQVSYLVDHHFCDLKTGELNVVVKNGSYWGYTGQLWKEISDLSVEHLLTKLISKSKGKCTKSAVRDFKLSLMAMISSRQISVKGADAGVDDFAYDEIEELENLPSYITPLRNCLYNWHTNTAQPHTKEYFYTKIVDCDYNPNAISSGVLYRLITEGLSTSSAMIKAMEMLAYSVAGGENTAQKYMCFTGAAGSGKSTLIEAMCALSPLAVGLSVSRYGDDQLLMGAAKGSFVYDDDVVGKLSTPQLNEMIKKLVSPSTVSLRELYSKLNIEVRLHKKAVWAYNEMPFFGDYSAAIMRRLEIVEFDISHTYSKKVNFEAMIRDPEQLSGILNEVIGFNKLHCKNNNVKNYAELCQKGNVKFTRDDRTNRSIDDSFRIANPLEVLSHVLSHKEGANITSEELITAARKLIKSLPQLEKMRGFSDIGISRRISIIMKHEKYRPINNIKCPLTGRLKRGYRDCKLNTSKLIELIASIG